MKTTIISVILIFASVSQSSNSPISEYLNKVGVEKIKKHINKINVQDNGFEDGHGKFPYFTSKEQLPDTIGLITFYVYDQGTTERTPSFVTTTNISESGGNYFANKLHEEAISKLKASFKAKGIVLLTPDEYLDTDEKKNFYSEKFQPRISKMGKFISGFEERRTDMAVCADDYRGFDVSAAADHERMISMGHELTSELGLDAVLSLAIRLQDDGKRLFLHEIKWTINGPNPVDKWEDHKYRGCCGAKYQEGLVYYFSSYTMKKPIEIARRKRKELTEENYSGFGDLLTPFMNCTLERWDETLTKNKK